MWTPKLCLFALYYGMIIIIASFSYYRDVPFCVSHGFCVSAAEVAEVDTTGDTGDVVNMGSDVKDVGRLERFIDDDLRGWRGSGDSRAYHGETTNNNLNNDNNHNNPQSQFQTESDSVIIVASVDGSLAGISRSSGQMLWKQSRDGDGNDGASQNSGTSSASSTTPNAPSLISWKNFLSPLVSTTTLPHANSASSMFVPSIDGTVYLTEPSSARNNKPNSDSTRSTHAPNADNDSLELVVSAHIRDLVDRAPFVDAHGRFFVGSRKAMVAAVDERTGEILRVIPRWKGRGAGTGKGTHDQENNEEDEEEELPPSLSGRNVVWIGRLEHAVTVHDLSKGKVDIEFSVAEILSVDEMIRGNSNQQRHSGSGVMDMNSEQDRTDDSYDESRTDDSYDVSDMEDILIEYIAEALRHPNTGDRLLELPPPKENDTRDIPSSATSQLSSSLPFLVATPSGSVAFRDNSDSLNPSSSSSGWVSFDLLQSPIVYAIEGSSGKKIKVNILPDVHQPSTSTSSSEDGLSRILEQQISNLAQSSHLLSSSTTPPNNDMLCGDDDTNNGESCAVSLRMQGSVVGALGNGQLYALPLGARSSSRRPLPLALPQPDSVLHPNHAIGFHHGQKRDGIHRKGEDHDLGDQKYVHIDSRVDSRNKHLCIPSNPLYPGCLIGASVPIGLMMEHLLEEGNPLDVASVFASNDLDFDLYLDMLEGKTGRKKNSFFHGFMKIMSSWIAPVVAFIFVLSFEFGRRERLKAEAKNIAREGNIPSKDNSTLNINSRDVHGVIELSDEILGYGGHGTIVYKGVLDKRQVAVKRLLKQYHASADREISLLIESDGHPNVVRYFLKETRGDFVYLALELCDMSLNDLIVCMGKLRTLRKENFQLSSSDTEDLETATKSLLLQIASGVKHIHSLRIVHRDLKPQNILLAHRSHSKNSTLDQENFANNSDSDTEIEDSSTCSDTNVVLESFKNGDYVPKISDMGLGKQLVGQSSFGMSTLGNGSVGAGPAGSASVAGAGAGSVGWQAPEVMALRWSPESSSLNEGSDVLIEASPQEAAVNSRTSRSVDIFSLGCIFYCTILPGSHPFGEWYEREANIMKNKPNKEDLEFVSPDAADLILSMIHREAKARPTACEVCEHPFFWTLSKRLKFLCDLSDRIELSDSISNENSSQSLDIFALEKGAFEVFGTSWEKKLDPELMEASSHRRTYDPASVRCLLRLIRNKNSHFEELCSNLKKRIGKNTDGLSRYISRLFPRLLMHCYHFCLENLHPEDPLVIEYKLPLRLRSSFSSNSDCSQSKRRESSDVNRVKKFHTLETISDAADQECEIKEGKEHVDILVPKLHIPPSTGIIGELQTKFCSKIDSSDDSHPLLTQEASLESESPDEECLDVDNFEDTMSGIVIWSGSSAQKNFKCRGWMRSDVEWIQRLDAKLARKRDVNVARCAEDPKFRTRLCNHWDISKGTYCPMRKKNKCIFAHGPVELRVKEGKRHRWGTLVRKDGLCANPCASGGEDTYGAARLIENTRKEQGQWSVDTTSKKQQGKATHNQQGKVKKKQSSKKEKSPNK